MRHTYFLFSPSLHPARLVWERDQVVEQQPLFGSLEHVPSVVEWEKFRHEFVVALGFVNEKNSVGEVKRDRLHTLLHTVLPTREADEIMTTLEWDVTRFIAFDPASKDYNFEQVLSIRRGMVAIAAHRILHAIIQRYPEEVTVRYQVELIAKHVQKETNVEIHPDADIGPGFAIDHGTGTVIGATTKIAPNVSIYHGVTLGATGKRTKNNRRHPIIGSFAWAPEFERGDIKWTTRDNVLLGNGVQVLGPSIVEDGCRLGSDARVINSFLGAGVRVAAGVTVDGVVVPSGVKIVASTPHAGMYIVEIKDQDGLIAEVTRQFPAFDVTNYEDASEESIRAIFNAFRLAAKKGAAYTLTEQERIMARDTVSKTLEEDYVI